MSINEINQALEEERTEMLITICPQCGYERTTNDDKFIGAEECPKCGIFYKKWYQSSVSKSEKQVEDTSYLPTCQDSTMSPNTAAMRNNKTILIIAAFLYTLITTTLFFYIFSKRHLSHEVIYVAFFLIYLPIFLSIYNEEVKMLYLNLCMIPAFLVGAYIIISSTEPNDALLLALLWIYFLLPVILVTNTICFLIKFKMKRKA